MRRIRHRVQMHVEQAFRPTADCQQRHRAGAMIGQRDPESGQVGAQIVEYSAGANGARRISGVEGHQGFEVVKNSFQHVDLVLL